MIRFALWLAFAYSTGTLSGAQSAAQYLVTTVAGGDRAGDGGPATDAVLTQPEGLAFDAAGNLYIADAGARKVRRVAADGTISTVAGNFRSPYSVAVDPRGDLFVADYGANRVFAVDPAGGNRIAAGGGDANALPLGSDPTSVKLEGPRNLVFARAGDLYISEHGGHRVLRLASRRLYPHVVTGLKNPAGLALDAYGALYVADTGNNALRSYIGARMTVEAGAGGYPTAGTAAAVAVDPLSGAVYACGPGLPLARRDSAGRWSVIGPEARSVAVDGSGRVYFSAGRQVYKLSAGGAERVAGQAPEATPAGAPAADVGLDGPIGIAVDAYGQLFIAEETSHRIRRVDTEGRIHTAAGTGVAGSAGDGGKAERALLNDPVAVAVDPAGGLRIAEYAAGRIRGVDASGNVFTAAAGWNLPRGAAFDASGNLYVAEMGAHRVRRIARDGRVGTIAGTGTPGYTGDGGAASTARLDRPAAVAVSRDGSVYIADAGNNSIRKVRPDGRIETVPVKAALEFPAGLAVGTDGELYIADTFHHRLLRVRGEETETIAGTGAPGYSGDGGAALTSAFDTPAGVAVDVRGNVFVADLGNGRVRKLEPVAVGELAWGWSVVHSATLRPGPVAPGQLLTVQGPDLDGVLYRWNGVNSQVIAASSAGAVIQAPERIEGRAVLEASRAGVVLGRVELEAVESSPGIFASGELPPATRGSVITLYATGEGKGVGIGDVRVTVGVYEAEVLWAGPAPGLQGVYQVNVRLPGAFTAPGSMGVRLWVRGVGSPEVALELR